MGELGLNFKMSNKRSKILFFDFVLVSNSNLNITLEIN